MRKTDEQLISDYLDGNEKAINVLVDKYLTDVYNFAFSLTKNLEASEDIAQESFIKAWKNIRGFRRGSSFKTWLFTITRNSAIDWLRQKKDIAFSEIKNKNGENMMLETIADKEPLPDKLFARAEDIQYVKLLLAELNPLYRDVLRLRYENSLTFEEIGKILKKSLHTVKSQHRRALIALRRVIVTKPV